MRVRLFAGVAVTTAAGIAPTIATAAPVWLPAQALGSSVEKQGDPQVVVNASGRAVSVWERYDGRSYSILAAVRAASLASWSVQRISPPGDAFNPQVMLARSGNAVAVFQRFEGGRQVIQAISRSAKGTAWRDLKTLSPTDSFNADLAGNAAGAAVAAWQHSSGGVFVVQSATRRPDGSWSAAQNLSAPGENAVIPQTAIDDAGNAVVVWQRGSGAGTVVQVASSRAGGPWSAPQTLSAQGGQEPHIGLSRSGEALAVWRRLAGADAFIEAAAWAVGAAVGPAQVLSQAGQRAREPDVAVSASGRALAVWTASISGSFVVRAALRAPGGAFGTAASLSQPRADAFTPRPALDAAGNAVALWARSDGSTDILQAATRPAGSATWLPVQNVTPPGGNAFDPQVALAGGRGVAVVVRSSGARWVWQALDYLASPPASGIVGRAYVAAFRKGPPVARLRGARNQIWAYFSFIVEPRRGLRLTVTWFTPSGQVAGSADKPRTRVVETSVVGRSLHLQKGVWRCVLRVGGRRVGEARVRVG